MSDIFWYSKHINRSYLKYFLIIFFFCLQKFSFDDNGHYIFLINIYIFIQLNIDLMFTAWKLVTIYYCYYMYPCKYFWELGKFYGTLKVAFETNCFEEVPSYFVFFFLLLRLVSFNRYIKIIEIFSFVWNHSRYFIRLTNITSHCKTHLDKRFISWDIDVWRLRFQKYVTNIVYSGLRTLRFSPRM